MSLRISRNAWTVVLLSIGICQLSLAKNQRGGSLMAALGDSITAGSFADNSAYGRSLAPWSPGSRSLPAIPVPFLGSTENKESYSWSSGESISSHFVKFRDWFQDEDLQMWNMAKPGAQISDLSSQIGRLRFWMMTGGETLQYVTLLIGANDVCAGNVRTRSALGLRKTRLLSDLADAFDQLDSLAHGEPLRVLVAGIPNIPDLGASEITNMSSMPAMSCGYVRNEWLGFCRSMLDWSTEREYDERVDTVVAMNEILAEAVESARQKHDGLEIHYSNRLFEVPVDPDWLARDCFHPNALGQEEISEQLWDDLPWAR